MRISLLTLMLCLWLTPGINATPYPGPHLAVQAHTLAWNADVGADGVNLYLTTVAKTGGGGDFTVASVIKVDAKTAVTYDFTTLMPTATNTTFYAIATGYTNAGAESVPSNEVTWVWDPTIPNPPPGLLVK